MSYNSQYGYVPETVAQIVARIIPFINAQFGTSYTEASFVGTNFYRFVYAIAQAMSITEIDTGEIYNKLQDYFRATNESITNPSTPIEGLIKKFTDAGYEVSFDVSTAGELGVCVNVALADEDYATEKAEIIQLLALNTAGGLVFTGDQTDNYTFTNGQAMSFGFFLPTVKTTLLKATIAISTNNTERIYSTAEVQDIIDANIKAHYQLGNNFEPQKYLTTDDLPFASTILFEYSFNAGVNWASTVYTAGFKDLVSYVKGNITVVIA